MFDNKEYFMFDLYGTLVDILTDESTSVLWSFMASYLSLKGAYYNDTDLRLDYGRICAKETSDLLSKMRKGKHKLDEEDVEIDLINVFKELYVRRGIKPSRSELEDTAIAFRSISTVKLRLYDGALEVLNGLRRRGKKLYLLSNAQACFTVPELKSLGIYDLFDGIFISSDVKVRKPSLAFYEKVLGDIDPSKCVMIGNDEFDDIRGAMSAGMDACYIQTAQSPSFPVNLPSVRINSLREITDPQ